MDRPAYIESEVYFRQRKQGQETRVIVEKKNIFYRKKK